jgi:type I restriction enzyme S subunit
MTLMDEQTHNKLPDGWRWVRLGDVCVKNTGNRNPTVQAEQLFQYVDISSVDNVGKCITSKKIILGKDAPSRARKIIKTHDIIVSTTRPNLNAVAMVPPDLDNQICSTGFCVLRSSREVIPEYLFAFVQSSEFIWNLSELVKGALYPAVTDSQVFDQFIPLPPLPEQQRIAAILSEQMAAVAEARAAAAAQLEAARALPSAFLRQVFESDEAQGWERQRLGNVCEIQRV